MSALASTHDPAGELRARGEALAEQIAIPGLWIEVEPGAATVLELELAHDGRSRIARYDLLPAVARLDRLALVSLAWLLLRAVHDPERVTRFSWSELGRLFGHQRLAAKNADGLRAAVRRAAVPGVHHAVIDLHDSHAPLLESVGGWLTWPPLLHQRGDGRHHPSQPSSRVRLDATLRPAIERGLFSAVRPEVLLEVRSELTRRLWFAAALLTQRPVDADGVCRVRLGRDVLLAALGTRDSRLDRARRAISQAMTEVGQRDPRFAGSGPVGDGHVLELVRSRPLDDPAAAAVRPILDAEGALRGDRVTT